MKPEFASQFQGTAHSEVLDIMERARHVTPYMVIAGYQSEPVFLFPAYPTGQLWLLRAWDQENGWHQRAAHLALRPQYAKGYPLPDELIHGIRVYTDTPGFKRARQGIK